MFHAEKMRPEDFPFAIRLANTMDWHTTEDDFKFMLKLEPGGSFVLFNDLEPVGIATCISYGKTGWFGNLAINEEQRNKGAGTFLLRHAIHYLRCKGVETVGLYAYQHLIGFYKSIGFKSHDNFAVLSGTVSLRRQEKTFREANEDDIPALTDFASRCLGGSREKLLKALLTNHNNLCYLASQKEGITGFAFAKVYEEMAEIGPLLCRRDYGEIVTGLLWTILSSLGNLETYAYAPLNEKKLLETLMKAGLKEEFRVTRMFLGPAAAEQCVYIAESLERG